MDWRGSLFGTKGIPIVGACCCSFFNTGFSMLAYIGGVYWGHGFMECPNSAGFENPFFIPHSWATMKQVVFSSLAWQLLCVAYRQRALG